MTIKFLLRIPNCMCFLELVCFHCQTPCNVSQVQCFQKSITALTCAFPIVNREGIVFYFLCNKMLTILQIHLYGQKNSSLWNLSHSCLTQQNRPQKVRTGEYVNLQMKCSLWKKVYTTEKQLQVLQNTSES